MSPKAVEPNGKITRAAVYARYSCHKQNEKSIEEQFQEAREYAAHHGLQIVKWYKDSAVSGRSDERDDFQQMLSDTGKGLFDVILIWKIDRFGRNREEIIFNKYNCKKHGVKVQCMAENIPDAPEGIILESVLEGMAEYYSVQLATNVRRGMRYVAKQGRSVGGTIPLGYRVRSDKHLEPDPDTAPLVRRIFEEYAAGKTQKQIADELTASGLRNRKGGPFTSSSLHCLLKNRKYIGIYHYNNEIEVPGGIPPIVDEETFYKVQDILKKNRRGPGKRWIAADYLLTGKLFCGHCGTTMVGECGTSKGGDKYHYYSCRKKKKRQGCKKRSVRQEWIEGLVLDYARRLVFDDDTVEYISAQVYEFCQKERSDNTYLLSLKKELDSAEKAMSNLIKALEAGIFNSATKSRMDELDAQIADLRQEIKETETPAAMLTREMVQFFLLQFRGGNWDDREFQKRIIHTFVNSVFLYDDKTVITFNYTAGGRETITLQEIDSIVDPEVSACSEMEPVGSPQKQRRPMDGAALSYPAAPGAEVKFESVVDCFYFPQNMSCRRQRIQIGDYRSSPCIFAIF